MKRNKLQAMTYLFFFRRGADLHPSWWCWTLPRLGRQGFRVASCQPRITRPWFRQTIWRVCGRIEKLRSLEGRFLSSCGVSKGWWAVSKGHRSLDWQVNVCGNLITDQSGMFLTFPVDSTSWYKPGQTPGSVLGEVSSSMEECRAEAVALYCESNSGWGLCANTGVASDRQWSAISISSRSSMWVLCYDLSRFLCFYWRVPPKYTDKQDIDDIQYITFLLMGRAGLRALEFYDPAKQKHGQAHMQARY